MLFKSPSDYVKEMYGWAIMYGITLEGEYLSKAKVMMYTMTSEDSDLAMDLKEMIERGIEYGYCIRSK